MMVGGDAAASSARRPVLETLASRVVHCGGVGAGSVAKACNQLIVVATIGAVAEALAIAEGAGVDPALVREAMLGGWAASPILRLHGERMLSRDWVPGRSRRVPPEGHRLARRPVVAVRARRHPCSMPPRPTSVRSSTPAARASTTARCTRSCWART